MAIVRVHHDYTSTSGPSLTAVSNSITTTAGNLLVVGVGQSTDSTPPIITNLGLDSWASIGSISFTNAADSLISLWYAKNINGHVNDIITATWTGLHQFLHLFTLEYSGLDTANPLDATPAPLNSGGVNVNSLTTGSFSTAQANELLVGLASGNTGGIVFTAGSESGGYTLVDGSGLDGAVDQDNIVSSIQTGVTMTITVVGSPVLLGLVGASFKAAGSAFDPAQFPGSPDPGITSFQRRGLKLY